MKKTHKFQDGDEMDLTKVEHISKIVPNYPLGVGVTFTAPYAWFGYKITISSGKCIYRKSKGWQLTYWKMKDKDPLEKNRILKDFERERNNLIKRWKQV